MALTSAQAVGGEIKAQAEMLQKSAELSGGLRLSA
jgi:hypothetical protein